MTIDSAGVLRDQNGDIGVVGSNGAIEFIGAKAISSSDVSGVWSSDPSQNGAITLSGGYEAYGCDTGNASAYQMFAFTASPSAMPSCTNVLLQVSLSLM
jgi:hypothetical protein